MENPQNRLCTRFNSRIRESNKWELSAILYKYLYPRRVRHSAPSLNCYIRHSAHKKATSATYLGRAS